MCSHGLNLALAGALIVGVPFAAAADRDPARDALRYVEDAYDAARDERDCRRVADDLDRIIEDLRDRPSERQLERIADDLERAKDDARRDCPRAVERDIEDAIGALSPKRDRGRNRGRIECWSKDDAGCEMQRNGKSPMDKPTFEAFLGALRNERNELTKEDICKKQFKAHYVSVAQLVEVLGHYRNELTMLEVVKAAAPHVVDPKNAAKLKARFRNSITASDAVSSVQKGGDGEQKAGTPKQNGINFNLNFGF